jgi:hypothetical protein
MKDLKYVENKYWYKVFLNIYITVIILILLKFNYVILYYKL